MVNFLIGLNKHTRAAVSGKNKKISSPSPLLVSHECTSLFTSMQYLHFLMSFLKSLGKNRKKWANKTEAVRILNRLQKTHDNWFKTLLYVCSEPQQIYICSSHKYRFIFFMVRNKHRVEFKIDFYAVYCKSFKILSASGLSAHFFWFWPRDFKKLTLIGHTYCVSDTGHFEWVFWSPWAKIEKIEPIILKAWEFWTDCKKKNAW